MKKLRKHADSLGLGPIRFFHCGEYGEQLTRPHYHALIFNFDFADKVFLKKTEAGDDIYVSTTLDTLWGKGHCFIGDVTFDSAAYVARYIVKKVTGERSDEHYAGRVPEYVTMSRRPGLGKGWFDKWPTDTYPSDSVVINGREFQPPKAYDRYLELDSPELFLEVKKKRLVVAPDPLDLEFATLRMETKRKVQELNFQRLKRSYEDV